MASMPASPGDFMSPPKTFQTCLETASGEQQIPVIDLVAGWPSSRGYLGSRPCPYTVFGSQASKGCCPVHSTYTLEG